MMGHRDFKTTLIYADYAPSAREAEWVEAAFAPRGRRGGRRLMPRLSTPDAAAAASVCSPSSTASCSRLIVLRASSSS
jgi:hypothetical protein